MFEMLLQQQHSTSPPEGPLMDDGTIKKGDATIGYYGQVLASNFITGDALAAAIGLTAGVAQNSDGEWLKFSYNSKKIYIAKKIYRTGISWQDIYQAGAVYGNDTNGVTPSGGNKAQTAKVTIAGKQYRVRLINSYPSDPAPGSVAHELEDLFQKVMALRGGVWESFSSTDLGWVDDTSIGIGAYNWAIQTYQSNTLNRLVYHPNTNLSMSQVAATGTVNTRGWRPVLELIP